MTKLSEHFTLSEFTYSETADAKGINNSPTSVHLNTLKHTCGYFLEPLRKLLKEHYGCKVIIKITSGYRSKALNNVIPGASLTSQHCTGEAADMNFYKVIGGKRIYIEVLEVYELVKKWVRAGKLSVDQCIYEVSGQSIWLHGSHSAWGKTRDRKQFLKYKNGKYTLDVDM